MALGDWATGLVFENQAPVVVSDPNRADIALFVGFVGRRDTPLPAPIYDWLVAQRWAHPDYGRLPLAALKDVPVPIDNWGMFDALFDWDARPLSGGQGAGTATTLLGAAVRSFFTQGGRKCYVVRVDDPCPVLEGRDRRAEFLSRLVPGYPFAFAGSPSDPAGWHGPAHVFGLPDVSFLCLPDLADLVGADAPLPPTDNPPAPAGLEVFTECSEDEPPLAVSDPVRLVRARRCDEDGYAAWARCIHMLGGALATYARAVQLVAGPPIPAEGTAAAGDLLAFLAGGEGAPLAGGLVAQSNGIASAFVQLAYPWPRTGASGRLPEGLESPEGVLAGVLARNALARGAYHSAAGLNLGDVYDLYPALSNAQLRRPHLDQATGCRCLLDRVSTFGQTPDGWRLLSDVTTSLAESHRPASINRLISSIVRAAQVLGEAVTFEASGEGLWAQVRQSLNRLLLGLLQAGALRGASPSEAYLVRCDRSTMTQNDIDAGRVIAEVQFDPVAPVDTITVVLALNEGGQMSQVSGE